MLWWDKRSVTKSGTGVHKLVCSKSDLSEYLSTGIEFFVACGDSRYVALLAATELAGIVDGISSESEASRDSREKKLKLRLKRLDLAARPASALFLPLWIRFASDRASASQQSSLEPRMVVTKKDLKTINETMLYLQLGRVSNLEECLKQELSRVLDSSRTLGLNVFMIMKVVDTTGRVRLQHRTKTCFRTFSADVNSEACLTVDMKDDIKALPRWKLYLELFHLEVPSLYEAHKTPRHVLLSSGSVQFDSLLARKASSSSIKLDSGGEVVLSAFFERNRQLYNILPRQQEVESSGYTGRRLQKYHGKSVTKSHAKEKVPEEGANSRADSSRVHGAQRISKQAVSKEDAPALKEWSNTMHHVVLEGTATVERALHLPLIRTEKELVPPLPYVVIEVRSSSISAKCYQYLQSSSFGTKRTAAQGPSCSPTWNESVSITWLSPNEPG